MRIYTKFKRIIIWTLILIIGLSHILVNFGSAQKAKAGLDKDGLWYEVSPTADKPPAQPRDVTVQKASDGSILLKWRIYYLDIAKSYDDIDQPQGSRNYTSISGFRIKSRASNPYDCSLAKGKTTNCSSGVTLTEGSELGDPVFSTENPWIELLKKWKSFSGGGPTASDYIHFELKDTTKKFDELNDGVVLGAQSIGVPGQGSVLFSYSEARTIVYRKTNENGNVDLGSAFSDDNIDAYIKNKLKPYEISGKDTPGSSDKWVGEVFIATADDRSNFQSFMQAFKNTSAGKNRIIMKKLESGTNDLDNIDPFGIQGVYEEVNGQKTYHPVLTEAELSAIYLKYYKNYRSFNDDTKFINFINEQIENWNNKMLGQKSSCQDLVNKLSTSAKYKDLYAQFGALLGGGAAVLGGLYTGGVSLTWTGGASAGGYVLGSSLEQWVRDSQKEQVDASITELAKEFYKAYYALLYVEFKEAKLGLEKYQTDKENLNQEYGLNPNKLKILNDTIAGMKDSWAICADLINQLMGQLYGDDNCGVNISIKSGITYFLATALCSVLKLIASLAGWLVDALFTSVFNAYHTPPVKIALPGLALFSIPQAKAAINVNTGDEYKPPTTTEVNPVSPLSQALQVNSGSTWPWVITIWKFVLALTNLLLVVILIFIGIVNILHIQYDTYNLKKALPLIIIGVILANFSLLICRMLIDAANILTKSFMGGTEPSKMMKELIQGTGLSTGIPSFASNWSGVGSLFIAVIFSVFAVAAFFILGIMFYMRYAAILLLAVAAPLAFVMMAFPPTQSMFKTWWSWTTKMIFMKPISFFLLFFALAVRTNGASLKISFYQHILSSHAATAAVGAAASASAYPPIGITQWIIIVALVYAAILIPWKLGGWAANLMGGIAGTIFGTKKGGWARKPVEEWWQRRKDKAGAVAKGLAPGFFAGAEADRQKVEQMKKNAQLDVQKRARLRNPEISSLEIAAAGKESEYKDLINKQMESAIKGETPMDWRLRLILGGITWQGGRPKLSDTNKLMSNWVGAEAELMISTKALEKAKGNRIMGYLAERGRGNSELRQRLAELKDAGFDLDYVETDAQGKLVKKNIYDGRGKNKKLRRATWTDYTELASILRTKAAATTDEIQRQNYLNSAQQLEDGANEFARQHSEIGGKRINYSAFMDKSQGGRILSVLTPLLMDEIQTNLLNENADSMTERLATQFGFQNIRANKDALKKLARGEYSKLDWMEALAGTVEYNTWLKFIDRQGGRDRGRMFANFLDVVDNGEFFEEAGKGAVLSRVIQKMEAIKPESSKEFIAEAILRSRQRGATLAGFTPDEMATLTTTPEGGRAGTITQVIDALNAHPDIDVIARIIGNPKIFGQLDLTPTPNNRAQIAFMNTVADILGEMPNFCGAGNLTSYALRTKDMEPSDWFKSLSTTDSATRQETVQDSINHDRTYQQSVLAQDRISTSSPQVIVDNFGGGNAERALSEMQGTLEKPGPAFEILRRASQARDSLIIGDRPIDLTSLTGPVADLIATSVATSFADLQVELQASFPGLSINLPNTVDTPENVRLYRNEVTTVRDGMRHIDQVSEMANSERVSRYTTFQANERPDSILSHLNHIESALREYNSALTTRANSDDPTGDLPPEVINRMIDALKERNSLVPLAAEALSANPSNLNTVLEDISVGLRALHGLRESGQTVDRDLLQRAILQELRHQRSQMQNQQRQAGGTQSQTQPGGSTSAGSSTPGGSRVAGTDAPPGT